MKKKIVGSLYHSKKNLTPHLQESNQTQIGVLLTYLGWSCLILSFQPWVQKMKPCRRLIISQHIAFLPLTQRRKSNAIPFAIPIGNLPTSYILLFHLSGPSQLRSSMLETLSGCRVNLNSTHHSYSIGSSMWTASSQELLFYSMSIPRT